MVVSVLGASGRTLARLRASAIAAGVLFALGFYAYGPVATPLLHGAATARCNELTGGSFRTYHLEWRVGMRPHWLCWDRSDLEARPRDLGWWVTPGL